MTSTFFPPLPNRNIGRAVTKGGRFIDVEVYGDIHADSGTLGDLAITGDLTLDGGSIQVGDIESSNWGGASPANLTSRDTSGTPAGYYLDSSVGSAQFEGDIFVGGDIDLTGTLTVGDTAPNLKLVAGPSTGSISFFTGEAEEDTAGDITGYVNSQYAGLLINSPILEYTSGEMVSSTLNMAAKTDGTATHSELSNNASGTADSQVTIRSDAAGSGDAIATLAAGSSTGSAKANVWVNSTEALIVEEDLVSGAALEWSTWSPSYSNLTIGNGTVDARYIRIGDTVHASFDFVLGSTSSVGTNAGISLPVTAENGAMAVGQCRLTDSGTASYGGFVNLNGTTQMLPQVMVTSGSYSRNVNLTPTVPFTWTTNDAIRLSITYEAA